MGPAQDLDSEAILNLRLFNQMSSNKHSANVIYSEYDLEMVFWLHFAKLFGVCRELVQFNAARTCLHCLLFIKKEPGCTVHICLAVAYSFNDFTIKNFASFIIMTLIIARKTITAVFDTMALQLTKIFQCSVTYSMKQTSSCF